MANGFPINRNLRNGQMFRYKTPLTLVEIELFRHKNSSDFSRNENVNLQNHSDFCRNRNVNLQTPLICVEMKM